MARKMILVCLENTDFMRYSENFANKLEFHSKADDRDKFGIFFDDESADIFARQMSERYPGKDVHIFHQSYGYSAPPKEVQKKLWINGNYIPETE